MSIMFSKIFQSENDNLITSGTRVHHEDTIKAWYNHMLDTNCQVVIFQNVVRIIYLTLHANVNVFYVIMKIINML